MNSWQKIKEKIRKTPQSPGVYIFFEKTLPASRQALYVGKASNLKNRLRHYIRNVDSKSNRLQKNAASLKVIPLRSEIEALIQEARIIKGLNPPYNVLWRDDSNYFYAGFTSEKFPKVFITHKPQHSSKQQAASSKYIGPFTDGRALKLVLKMLRRNFPYCTCPKPHYRICLNTQLGNCPGFCCQKDILLNKDCLHQYQKNIRIIKNFILGKPLKGFGKNLKSEEKEALKKILAHREFLDYAQINVDGRADKSGYNIRENPRSNLRKSAILIEGYDISHLSGKETIGVMTHWRFNEENLEPQKNLWRKFIIRTAKAGDDPAAIYETVSRRLNHPEWPLPDLMIIDGGLGQWLAAEKALKKMPTGFRKKIKLISLAKPQEKVYGSRLSLLPLKKITICPPKIIARIIQETHNFAIRSHRQRRRNEFLKF